MALSEFKTQLQLTPAQADVWARCLTGYADHIAARALLTVARTPGPFADLGQVLALCDELRDVDRVENGGPPPRGDINYAKPTRAQVDQVAEALGISLKRQGTNE